MLPSAAIMDWDDTLHRGITLLPWVKFLSEHSLFARGRAEAVTGLFDRASAGLISYEQFTEQVVEEYAKGLTGFRVEELTVLAQRFVERDSQQNIYAFVSPMLSLLHDRAIKTIIISGCPQEVIDAYRPLLGFSCAYGALVRRDQDGVYSGDVEDNPALAERKEARIAKLCSEYVVAIAMGNTNSDWPLLKRAELPLLVNSKPAEIEPRIRNFVWFVDEGEILPRVRQFLQHRSVDPQ